MNIENRQVWWRGCVATGVCVVLAVPLAAAAKTVPLHDPSHDVVLYTYNETFKPVPTNKAADITKATFGHTATRVTAKITLRHYGGGEWMWDEVITTPRQWYWLSGTKEPGSPLDLAITRAEQETPFTCTGLTSTIRPAQNTIQVYVPTKCLGTPRWVRLNLLFWKFSPGKGFYIDDALRQGFSESSPFGETGQIYAGRHP